jgi:hypothetical protein
VVNAAPALKDNRGIFIELPQTFLIVTSMSDLADNWPLPFRIDNDGQILDASAQWCRLRLLSRRS